MIGRIINGMIMLIGMVILLIGAGITGLYLYGLQDLPADTAPVREWIPPVVKHTFWVAEAQSPEMVMPSLSPLDWVRMIVTRDHVLPHGYGVASISARLLLARNPDGARQGPDRRLVSWWAATIWVSHHWTAEEAVSTILNTGYFGHGWRGIHQAAQGYFRLSPAQLSVSEAALLAVVFRSPDRYDPWRRPDRVHDRARKLVRRYFPGVRYAPRLRPSPPQPAPAPEISRTPSLGAPGRFP